MRPIMPFTAIAFLFAFAPISTVAQDDADTREVLAYRLTMPKLRQLNQALADFYRQREADPVYKALLEKKKELATLSEKENLSEAEEERMLQLETEIAEAEEAEMADDTEESLDGMAQRIAANPMIAGAVQRAGLTPREAATLQLALLQTAMTVGLLESGTIRDIPKEVNAENVRFYQANKAEIEALTALMAQGEPRD